STLVPYTTLFRSVDVGDGAGGEGGVDLLLLVGVRHPLELDIDAGVVQQGGHHRAVRIRSRRGVEDRHPGQRTVAPTAAVGAGTPAGGQGQGPGGGERTAGQEGAS